MSAEIEQQLRAVFEQASDWVEAPADLAGLVRRSTRRRRRILAIAVTVIALVSGAGYAVAAWTGPHGPQGVTGHRIVKRHGPAGLPTSGGADLLAAGGSMLYVATGDYPRAALAAYDRATGHLVRRVRVPAAPSALRIGPDGLVWLAFYPDSHGGGTGVWLLSPDLSRRSVLDASRHHVGAAPFDVLPTGPDSALLATDQGLAAVRLPAPGSEGQPELRWTPSPSMPRFGLTDGLAMVAGKAAVRQQRDGRLPNSVLSFAAQTRPVFRPRVSIFSMAGQGDGVWITTANSRGATGTLIRLDEQLQPATPRSIRANPLFAAPQQVQAHGSTVWIVRSRQPYLACFAYHGQVGRVGTVRTSHRPAEFAATAGTVYVASSAGVASYSVPAECR